MTQTNQLKKVPLSLDKTSGCPSLPRFIPGAEFKAYLESVNQGLNENEWKVTCIRFAPNDPTQNPVEDIWLYAKKFVREFYHLCKSFASVKRLFELVTHHQIFDFPKMFMYDLFSRII